MLLLDAAFVRNRDRLTNMLARDLAEDFPVVTVDTPALEATKLLATQRLPGIVVTEANGRPKAILPASQVLRFVIPDYIQDDPSLARVVNERAADRIAEKLAGRTVGELLPSKPAELPVLNEDDTVIEIAALMARMHSPLVAIMSGDRIVGVVTASHLLELVCSS